MVTDFLIALLALMEEMAPYLLLGFLIAGVLHVFVPNTLYRKYLGGDNVRSVILAVLFGIPLPLCSCGVIPTAVGMHKDGASKGATTAFLIATPQTGVDSILATYSMLGLPFAILRPIVALVTGVVGGIITTLTGTTTNETSAVDIDAPAIESTPSGSPVVRALSYAFTDMLMDIGRWLVIGLVLAALITVLVPNDFFVAYRGNYVINMLIVILIACPMYVCATGSIPIAVALMMKGLSPGAALVFLMAGPATNMASMMVLGKTLGRRTTITYLASIIVGAVGFGVLVDILLPVEWFVIPMGHYHSACCHDASLHTTWWQDASTIVLTLLLVRALYLRFRKKNTEETIDTDAKDAATAATVPAPQTFTVEGMMCNHCKANVERGVAAVEGVTSVEVDLASGLVTVEGTATPESITAAIIERGYTVK